MSRRQPVPAQTTSEDVQLRALSARLRTLAGSWTRQYGKTAAAAAVAPEGKAAMTVRPRPGSSATRMGAADREAGYRLGRPRRKLLTGPQARRIAHKAGQPSARREAGT